MGANVRRPDTQDAYYQYNYTTKLFLAGSIENGKAHDWQEEVANAFRNYSMDIYNPRRYKWDASLENTFLNETFREQVVWEQKYLVESQYVLMNLLVDTKSPISLLELGQLSMMSKKTTVVACPKGFWRRGNVEIVCSLHNIPLYETLDEAVAHLKTIIPK